MDQEFLHDDERTELEHAFAYCVACIFVIAGVVGFFAWMMQ